VPREALKREAACFLRPDFDGLNGANDFDCDIALNSSNWRNLPLSLFSYNPLDLDDRPAMPVIDRRILRRS
jgi:hypothetical protein